MIYNMLMETDTIGILIDFFIYELNNLFSLKAIYLHDGESTEQIRKTRRCIRSNNTNIDIFLI